MTGNSISQFDHDEMGFAAWLAAHPTGFVVNTTRSVPANYRVLHRATRWTIRAGRKGAEPGAFTERACIKICSSDVSVLKRAIGPLSRSCSIRDAPNL